MHTSCEADDGRRIDHSTNHGRRLSFTRLTRPRPPGRASPPARSSASLRHVNVSCVLKHSSFFFLASIAERPQRSDNVNLGSDVSDLHALECVMSTALRVCKLCLGCEISSHSGWSVFVRYYRGEREVSMRDDERKSLIVIRCARARGGILCALRNA